MDNITIYRIDTLLEHIDLVLSDTKDLSIEQIAGSSLLLRATSFSISQIGEMMNQLEKQLGKQYPTLPWADAKAMRNVIVHDYGKTDIEQIYSTIQNDLPILKAAFLEIKSQLGINK